MPITEQQRDTLRLLQRSPDRGDGWRTCAPKIFEVLIAPMPDELVEKDAENLKVRLTPEGQSVVTWI